MQDIRFVGADAPVPNWFASMNLLGIGGTLAAIGILLFVIIALTSLLSGSQRQPEMVAEARDLWPAGARAASLAGAGARMGIAREPGA